MPIDYVSGSPVWSSVVTYVVVPSTTDANGNGIQDEGALLRVQDGQSRVLCDEVVPGGFQATRDGDTVTVQVLLLERHDTQTISAGAAATVTLRNG